MEYELDRAANGPESSSITEIITTSFVVSTSNPYIGVDGDARILGIGLRICDGELDNRSSSD
jgi:hypothetical protein